MIAALPAGAGAAQSQTNKAVAELAWQAGDAISAAHFAPADSCIAFGAAVARKAPKDTMTRAFTGCFASQKQLPGEAWLALLTLAPKDRTAMAGNNENLKALVLISAALPKNPKAVDLATITRPGDGATALRASLTPGATAADFSAAFARLLRTRQKQHTSLRLLATGFEPFGGFPTNPSWDSLQRMDALAWARRGVFLLRLELPVAYGGAETELVKFATRHKPHMILSTGLAASSPFIRIETRAFNGAVNAKDNNGNVLKGKIKPKGPKYLNTAFDTAAMVTALKAKGFEADTSDDAGGYLCNYVYYIGGNWCAGHGCKNLFVHVPKEEKGWTLQRIAKALDIVVDTMVNGAAAP